MPTTLPVDRRHDYDELALYVQVEGKLIDAYKVEYEVYDESAGYPGAIIAPGATRQDVTDTDGHFATGCYGVIDLGSGDPWTPDAEISRGRVYWYYTLEAGGPEYVVERIFEVVATSVTKRPTFNLWLIQDLLDHPKIAEIGTPPDARTTFNLLKVWTQRITLYCGQHFYPKRGVRRFKWRPNAHLFLPVPLFGLTSFLAIDESTPMSLSELVVWGATDEERRNPKIEMYDARPGFGLTVMTTVKVDGVWGFIEEDTLDAPLDMTTEALKVLARALFDAAHNVTSTVEPFGPLKREKTDGHEVEYAVVSTVVRSGMMALLKDPALRDALDLYRRPIGVAATGAA